MLNYLNKCIMLFTRDLIFFPRSYDKLVLPNMYLTFFVLSLLCGFCVLGKENKPEECPHILSKKEWGGRDAETIQYTIFPLGYAIIQHTVTDECHTKKECSTLIQSIQNYHIDRLNFGDIGYNFLIGGDGQVYEGRGWHKQGAHLVGYNSKSIGIAFIGNFQNTLPPNKALQVAKKLLACGVKLGELSTNYKLHGARQLMATESPGVKLYNKIRNWNHFTDV